MCVCGGGGGENNIKEGSPHGSRAPSGRLRRQLKKTSHAVLAACGPVSGACSGRGRGPRLSQNLWGWGVMSPLSLLFRAVCVGGGINGQVAVSALSSGRACPTGGGGGLWMTRCRLPFLTCPPSHSQRKGLQGLQCADAVPLSPAHPLHCARLEVGLKRREHRRWVFTQ